jgi:hypothetical protein
VRKRSNPISGFLSVIAACAAMWTLLWMAATLFSLVGAIFAERGSTDGFLLSAFVVGLVFSAMGLVVIRLIGRFQERAAAEDEPRGFEVLPPARR